jgi:RNA polymerase sigma factor (sigma-70 family)
MTRLAAQQLSASSLREVLRGGGLDDLPDAELLQRFARYGEHPAFDVLLRRYGPMVLGVCRRVLAHSADAEDAFQATFLVLVRKARTLRHGERVGPWLYGVAVRIALKARIRRARLAAQMAESIDMIPDPTAPNETPDWLPVLDAELQALPAKYREPLVLCELRGASRAEAARSLGIPEGTLSSRLARGRELLRRRLLKHGTLLPAGGLTALLAMGGMGRAGIPAALFHRTSELAANVATGSALAGTVPAGAAQLMDEVLKGMILSKLRTACGAVLALGLVTAGMLAARPTDDPAPTVRVVNAKAAPTKPGAAIDPNRFRGNGQELRVEFADKVTIQKDREALQGLWVVDKLDVFKSAPAEQAEAAKQMIGKMQFLVAGDVWWGMVAGEGEGTTPLLATIDETKNPKWLDLGAFTRSRDVTRCIYEITGDKLRICMGGGTKDPRPAEFGSEEDSRYIVFEFRREKLPSAAGDKALVGSWENPFERIGVDEGRNIRTPIQRVEVLDGYLFFTSTEDGKPAGWIGGKYTVDTTKNPRWIDVELAGPLFAEKASKLYGSYEVVDGRLKMALGVKRLTRPLDFSQATDAILLDVKATTDPIPLTEKVIHEPPAVKLENLPGPAPASVEPNTPNVPVSPLPGGSPSTKAVPRLPKPEPAPPPRKP